MYFYKKFFKATTIIISFALILNITRIWLVGDLSYIYLNWNLFLALLPVLFAFLFEFNRRFKLLSIVYFLGWLLFLPNAPYIITDFIHLRDVGTETMLWYDSMMIFGYALAGMYAFVFSLERVSQFFQRNFLFVFVISLLSGFGIYLGRYIRWNTWNIVTHPIEFFSNVMDIVIGMNTNTTLLLTVAVFTLGLISFFYSYIFANKNKNS